MENRKNIIVNALRHGAEAFLLESENFKYWAPSVNAFHPILADQHPLMRDMFFAWRPTDGKGGRADIWSHLRVRAGVAHDFATVPWSLRSFLSRTGAHADAAIIHDACYINFKRLRDGETAVMDVWDGGGWAPLDPALDREDADLLFLDAMKAVGKLMKGYQRWYAYRAVRLFGGSYFNGKLGVNYMPEVVNVIQETGAWGPGDAGWDSPGRGAHGGARETVRPPRYT